MSLMSTSRSSEPKLVFNVSHLCPQWEALHCHACWLQHNTSVVQQLKRFCRRSIRWEFRVQQKPYRLVKINCPSEKSGRWCWWNRFDFGGTKLDSAAVLPNVNIVVSRNFVGLIYYIAKCDIAKDTELFGIYSMSVNNSSNAFEDDQMSAEADERAAAVNDDDEDVDPSFSTQDC